MQQKFQQPIQQPILGRTNFGTDYLVFRKKNVGKTNRLTFLDFAILFSCFPILFSPFYMLYLLHPAFLELINP
jgi:hypothetical protein